MTGVVIPCRDGLTRKAIELSQFHISRSELGANLLFFDCIGYFTGYRPPAVMIRIGEPTKMILPDDPALNDAERPLIRPFYTIDPEETVAYAMAFQMRNGYSSTPEQSWVYHPKYFQTEEALKICGGNISPTVGMKFLDGIFCPPDTVPLEEVVRFREDRAPEHKAFMNAIFSASEGLSVENNNLVLNTPIHIVENALRDLNRTAIERWAGGVKRSFKWGIRLNERSLVKLGTAVAGYDYLGNMTASLLFGMWGLVEFSVDLTPAIEPPSAFTKAMSFAWDVQRQFDNPNSYTRYRLKRSKP